MKKAVLTTLLLVLNLTACEEHKLDSIDSPLHSTSFDRPESLFSVYIEKLDSEFNHPKVQYRNLCSGYSYDYKTNYLPNLLKFASNNYDELSLIADLNIVLENYKSTGITRC